MRQNLFNNKGQWQPIAKPIAIDGADPTLSKLKSLAEK